MATYQREYIPDQDIFTDATRERLDAIKAERAAHGLRIGFTASSFDLVHPGHILMLKEAREQCDLLVCALQTDPTLNRPDTKNRPIQTLEERRVMLSGVRYVDRVIEYATEKDLLEILRALKPDVRILGSDWQGKPYTGHELSDIPCFFHDRSGHSWSTTKLRRRIYEAERIKRKASE